MRLGVLCGASLHRFASKLGFALAFAFWLLGSQAAYAAVTVTPTTLPAGTLGVAYDETVIGNGGTGPYTFAITAGTLPTGISLDGTTGQLS